LGNDYRECSSWLRPKSKTALALFPMLSCAHAHRPKCCSFLPPCISFVDCFPPRFKPLPDAIRIDRRVAAGRYLQLDAECFSLLLGLSVAEIGHARVLSDGTSSGQLPVSLRQGEDIRAPTLTVEHPAHLPSVTIFAQSDFERVCGRATFLSSGASGQGVWGHRRHFTAI